MSETKKNPPKILMTGGVRVSRASKLRSSGKPIRVRRVARKLKGN